MGGRTGDPPRNLSFFSKRITFFCVCEFVYGEFIHQHTNLGEFLDGHTQIHRKNVILGMLVIYGHTSTYPLVI